MARAVIALCTPSVSQMAYPTERKKKKRNMTRAAVRFSFPSPCGRRACRRLQCCIHRRRSRTLKYYRIPINSSAVAPVPTLGGFRCWLPLTGCSIDFQKCQAPPSIVQETGPTGAEMARQGGVARVRALTGDGAKMAGGEGIRLRRSFPNLLQRSHP